MAEPLHLLQSHQLTGTARERTKSMHSTFIPAVALRGAVSAGNCTGCCPAGNASTSVPTDAVAKVVPAAPSSESEEEYAASPRAAMSEIKWKSSYLIPV